MNTLLCHDAQGFIRCLRQAVPSLLRVGICVSHCLWVLCFFFFFFFFSSRRRHTRCLSDWSSECALPISTPRRCRTSGRDGGPAARVSSHPAPSSHPRGSPRSEAPSPRLPSSGSGAG